MSQADRATEAANALVGRVPLAVCRWCQWCTACKQWDECWHPALRFKATYKNKDSNEVSGPNMAPCRHENEKGYCQQYQPTLKTRLLQTIGLRRQPYGAEGS